MPRINLDRLRMHVQYGAAANQEAIVDAVEEIETLRELVGEMADAMRDHLDVGPSSTLYYVKQLLSRAEEVK